MGKHFLFLRARRLAAYLAADGELDPAPLLELAWQRHKECHLPVLRPHPRRKLWFVRHRPGEPLTPNRYRIPEPSLRQARIRLPWSLDMLLLPLVGFDTACNRLGMGGGFYDRSFAFLLEPDYRGCRPWLIGLGYTFQKVAALPRQRWDVPLDAAATEHGLHVFGERA